MREILYTMFISNKRASSQLWWKENLVKHERVSKYDENDCVQNRLLHFMSSLTVEFVKNSNIYARIYFISLTNVLKQTCNDFNIKFRPQWKDWKSSYQLSKLFLFFATQFLYLYVKTVWEALELPKLSKKIKFEGVWCNLQSKKHFRGQSVKWYLRLALVSM